MNPSASRPQPSPSPSPALPTDSRNNSTTSKSLIKDQILSSQSSIKTQTKRYEHKISDQDNDTAIKVTSAKPSTPPTDDSKGDDSGSEAETIVLQGSRQQPRYEATTKVGNSVEGPQRNGQKRGMRGSKRLSGHDNVEDLYSSDLSSAPSSPQPRLSTKGTTNGAHRRTISSIGNGDSVRPKNETSESLNDHTLASRKRKITRVSSKLADLRDGDSPNGSRHKSLSPSSSTRALHRTTAIQNSYRRGHTRTRSAQTLGSPAKTLKSRKPHMQSLYFHGDLSDDHSLSSSRSCSPDHALRHRGRSPSDNVASPARIITSHRSKRDTTGRTTFWKRCEKGLLPEAKKLLELNPGYLIEVDNGGYLPIHAAALNGRDEVTRFLIQAGSPIDQAAQDLSTPLFDAVDNRHINVMKLLLEAGADPRRRNKTGQTVLDAAAEAKRQAIEDSDTTAAEEIGVIENALQTAVVKLRSKRTHDEDSTNTAENNSSRGVSVASPVHMSPPPTSAVQTTSRRRTGRSEPTRQDLLWLDSGKGGMQKLKDSSKNGDIEMVGKLLESGNMPDDESVILAAKGGHIDVLSLLLGYGGNGDPDPKESIKRARDKGYSLNPGEETPILAIIGRGGNIEILKLLLKTEGMNARRHDIRGRTYVELAKERAGDNWEEEVRLLQKAWDDASPRSKKNKEKNNRDASPALSVKSKTNQSTKSTSLTADDTKTTKRQHRRSISEAVSSINGDGHVYSDKDSSATKKLKPARNDDMDRREKERKAVDSDNSTFSDANAVSGTVKKKRRLISGKDLAAKVSNKVESDAKTVPSFKTLPTIVKNEEVELSDGKTNARRGSESSAYKKPLIKRENSDSIKIVSTKRNRESSTSSTTRTAQQDKSSDTETSLVVKKKQKLESRQEKEPLTAKVKTKEEKTRHVSTPTSDAPKQNKLRAERVDDDTMSNSSSGRKRSQDADPERRKKKIREDGTKSTKKEKRTDANKEHNSSEKPAVTSRLAPTESKMRHMDSKQPDAEKHKHNNTKADAIVSTNRNKSHAPSPYDENARVLVLLREQRSFQEKGLIAGATQREAFKLIKAEKDREREAMERAEREEEEERQEEERRQNELLLEKQRIEEAQNAERLRQEIVAREKEAIRRASELEALQRRIAEEQQARQKREEELEQARIESLPYVFKIAALGKPIPETDLSQGIHRFLPLYVHRPDHPALKEATSDVGKLYHDDWISNVQAVLLLDSASDLEMKSFHIEDRRPMQTSEQSRLRNLFSDMYYFGDGSSKESFDMNADWQKQDKEGDKFEAMKHLFWIRVSDFIRIAKDHNKCGNITQKSRLPLVKISTTPPVYNTSNPWK